jgi:hypothetical protein
MIGKIVGAMAGAKMANSVRGGLGGPGGALLGAGAASVAKRLGPVGLIAALAGGYFLKRHYDQSQSPSPKTTAKPKAKRTAS